MDDSRSGVVSRGLTPRDFFALRIPGALMQDAHRETRIAYSTIHGLAKGANASEETLIALALWARSSAAAQAAGVHISLDAIVDAKARTQQADAGEAA